MFDALLAGRMLLKRRGERVTYNTVRHIVENTTHREFKVEHLAQMRHLRPESFDWQYIHVPAAKNPKSMEWQLLLVFERAAAANSSNSASSAGRYSTSQEQADFRAKLMAFWQQQQNTHNPGDVPQVPQAPLPPKASTLTASRSASLPFQSQAQSPASSRQRFESPLGMRASSLPEPMAQASSQLTPTRHRPVPGQLQCPGSASKGAPGAGPMDIAEQAPLELSQQHSMMHTASGSSPLARAGGSAAQQQATPQSKARPPPLQLAGTPTQQDARLARLHSLLSPAALQKIQEAEAVQAAQTPEAKRHADMRQAVQMLPHAFDLVRGIFGPQGPIVKPCSEVTQLMCDHSNQRTGLTLRLASNALVALARAVPEYLRIEDPRVMADGSTRPRSVIISRAINANSIAQKLRAMAADCDTAASTLLARAGSGAATASPGGSDAGPGAAAAAMRPQGSLQPMALEALLGSGGSGGDDSAPGPFQERLPVAPPSARKRPPGLPLAPMSPLPRGLPPTPKSRAQLPLAAAQQPVAPRPEAQLVQPAVQPSVSGVDRGGEQEAAPLAPVPNFGRPFGTPGKAPRPNAAEAGGEQHRVGGQTPERTPGRTAVQGAMLDSIKRSSAHRGRRQLLLDCADEGGASAQEGDEQQPPGSERRRLEDVL